MSEYHNMKVKWGILISVMTHESEVYVVIGVTNKLHIITPWTVCLVVSLYFLVEHLVHYMWQTKNC